MSWRGSGCRSSPLIVVSAGLVCMWKVHQFSEPEPVITVNGPQAPEEFNIKRLTYEVFGSVGKGGKLVYVDIDGHPHQVDVTTLPWSHTETTTLTVASGIDFGACSRRPGGLPNARGRRCPRRANR